MRQGENKKSTRTKYKKPNPLAKRVVEIARAEGADAVCHGSTGKGNDQVRFELAIMHFAPDLKMCIRDRAPAWPMLPPTSPTPT